MSAGSTISSKLRIVGVAAGLAFAASAHGDSVGPYAWPLSEDAGPTSTFGEYRSGRFHMGLDLSTRGQVGLPIRAVAAGEIQRVRASGVGYGRAIYLKLDDGPLVVYAHLNDYYAPLAAYVASEQKRLGRYEVNLYPETGRFRVERGDVIGSTGDSGAGAPHLHFEWRNDVGDVAVNPFHVGFRVADTRPPSSATWRCGRPRHGGSSRDSVSAAVSGP